MTGDRENHFTKTKTRGDIIVVVSIAFVVRLFWLWFGRWEANDSQWYIATARNLIDHHAFSADGIHATAYRPPLYSTLIAALWWSNAVPLTAVLVTQVLLGTITVAVVYLITKNYDSRLAALVASVGLALAPLTAHFTVVVLTETLFTFLVVLGIYCWSRQAYALTGIAFGLGVLTRVTLLPFVLLIPLLGLTSTGRKQWRGLVCITAVALAISSIWIVRNAIVFHSFIPVAASGYGTNLLIGSMELREADNVERRKALLANIDAAGALPSTNESEFDRVRFHAAVERIKTEPAHWVMARTQQYPRLFVDSGSYIFGADGVPLRTAIGEGRWAQVFMRMLIIAGNLLTLLLAGYGMVVNRSRLISLAPIILFPAYLILVALPLWIEPRYGLPMMPSVAILAAMGVVSLLQHKSLRSS